MLNNNFNAEESIKKWAGVIRTIGIAFMCLCGVAALIVLCADAQDLWWVSLIILAVGGLSLLSTSFSWVLVWGFGDLVGNTQKFTTGAIKPAQKEIDNELPDL